MKALQPNPKKGNSSATAVLEEELPNKEATNQDSNLVPNDIKPTSEEDLLESLKLPKLPCRPGGRLPNIEVANDWFNLVTSPNAQDRIYIYLYRVWPKINRPRSQKYLDKVPLRLYSFNKIISNNGGGQYKMIVTDASNPNGSLFEVLFDIDSQLYDPILNLAELDLEAKENKSYVEALKNKGVIDSNGKGNMIQTTNPLPSNVVTANDKASEVLGDVVKQLLNQQTKPALPPTPDNNLTAIANLFLEKLRQEDPNKGLTGIAEIIKAVTPTQQPVKQDDTVTRMLLDEVKELRASNSRLMEKMIEQQSAKPTDNSIDQIEKVLTIVDRIKHRSDEEEDKPVAKQSIVDKLLDRGLPLLAPVIQGMMLKSAGLANPNTMNDLAALNNDVSSTIPQNYPINSIDSDVQQSDNRMTQQSTNTQTLDHNPQLVSLVTSYGGMIAPKIISGLSGWEFALDLDNVFGDLVWKQVIQFTPDQILTAFKQVPPFWQAIQFKGEDTIKQWIIEFIEFRKYAEQNNQEQEQEEYPDDIVQ